MSKPVKEKTPEQIERKRQQMVEAQRRYMAKKKDDPDWKAKNAEKSRKWREEHREESREYIKLYMRDYLPAYYQANKEKMLADDRARRARQKEKDDKMAEEAHQKALKLFTQ